MTRITPYVCVRIAIKVDSRARQNGERGSTMPSKFTLLAMMERFGHKTEDDAKKHHNRRAALHRKMTKPVAGGGRGMRQK